MLTSGFSYIGDKCASNATNLVCVIYSLFIQNFKSALFTSFFLHFLKSSQTPVSKDAYKSGPAPLVTAIYTIRSLYGVGEFQFVRDTCHCTCMC